MRRSALLDVSSHAYRISARIIGQIAGINSGWASSSRVHIQSDRSRAVRAAFKKAKTSKTGTSAGRGHCVLGIVVRTRSPRPAVSLDELQS